MPTPSPTLESQLLRSSAPVAPAVLDLSAVLKRAGLIPVVTLEQADDAPALAEALLNAGVSTVELTLRTPQAMKALYLLRRAAPTLCIGAGTVLNPLQADQAQDAGANFGLAPGLDPATVLHCAERGFPFIPGVATPSEMQSALRLECRVLKFFAAEPLGGARALGIMAAPFAHLGVSFLPLGGIRLNHLAEYAAEPLVAAVGGSWIAPAEEVRRGMWSSITNRAREAVAQWKRLTAPAS